MITRDEIKVRKKKTANGYGHNLEGKLTVSFHYVVSKSEIYDCKCIDPFQVPIHGLKMKFLRHLYGSSGRGRIKLRALIVKKEFDTDGTCILTCSRTFKHGYVPSLTVSKDVIGILTGMIKDRVMFQIYGIPGKEVIKYDSK